MHVKWSVTFADPEWPGPEILTVSEIKGQVLHRVRLHVKVPGWSLDLNALLTRKLPKFLSVNWDMVFDNVNPFPAEGFLTDE